MDVKSLLSLGREMFKNAENSLLNTEVLLAHTIGESKEYLLSHNEEQVEDFLIPVFENYIKRAVEGEPIAYIVGEKEFYGINFFVDKRVLVPRPETEQLVEVGLKFLLKIKEGKKQIKILDIGTGSGNIIISIIKSLEKFPVEVYGAALDVSEDALEVTRLNVEQHNLEDRIEVFQSDLLSNINFGENFDLIVANLPYIGEEKNNFVSSNVQKFEPNVALFGGLDGLDLYRKLFRQMSEKEMAFGMFLGEYGAFQTEELNNILEENFTRKFEFLQDLSGLDRVFVIY